MKNKLFTLCIFAPFLFFSANAQIKLLLDQNLDSLITDKLIFIDVSTSWCGPCKYMEQYVFTDTSVSNYYNKNFISLKYDAEKGYGKIVRDRYVTSGYPTYVFLKPDKSIILIDGRNGDALEFLNLGRAAVLESLDKRTIYDWEVAYKEKKSDTAFLKSYLYKRMKLGMDNKHYLDQYYSLLSPAEVETQENQILIFYNNIGYGSKLYHYVLNKQKNHISYNDVKIIDPFDPKEKIINVLTEKSASVSPTSIKTFLADADKTLRQMNTDDLDYQLEYIPIQIKAYNQISQTENIGKSIQRFETFLQKLTPQIIEAENKKRTELLLSYYKSKGTLDSLLKDADFKTRLAITSTLFNDKLEKSYYNIKTNVSLNVDKKYQTRIAKIHSKIRALRVRNIRG